MKSTNTPARRLVRLLPLRWMPLDFAVRCSQRITSLFAKLLFIRDWQLEARGRPQFFKHAMNLAQWPFEPARWAFTARGVYAREAMHRGCKVLDLCCGDGAYSRLFFADIAGHVDAVDFDAYAINYASRYHGAPGVRFHRMDIVNEPLPDRDYDVVVWNAAICYFTEADIGRVIDKIVAASRPSVKLIGMLPRAHDWVDHKIEFATRGEVESFLQRFFSDVAVREIDEGSAVSFYFQATSPVAPARTQP